MVSTLSTRTRTKAVALCFLILSSIVTTTNASATKDEFRSVIVRAAQDLSGAARAIVEAGGNVRSRIDLIGAVVADVPARGVGTLEQDRRVASITNDYELKAQGNSFGEALSSAYPAAIGATKLWENGLTGEGIGVALLDTGVNDHPDLAGRIVASADLTGEGTFTDSYGHGTFMAGLIAGDGTSSGGRYVGVAPRAHLMSVKVAGADGSTTLGQVLYGLQLIDSAKERYGVRVVVIALAGPSHEGPDPLELALERLWADGLTVIVAVGNDGPGSGSVASPGVDPYVMTVGASNDAGTADRSDDSLPEWSARGPSPDGIQKPDLVAPGTSVVSLRSTGSSIDTDYPNARVDEGYFRGSGTSMSTAVAAGAAALLIEAEPKLSPDKVKGRFLESASQAPRADPAAVGRGVLDVAAAAESTAGPANGDLVSIKGGRVSPPADPDGSGNQSFDWYQSPVGADRWLGRAWAGRAWAGRAWAGRAWAGRAWADADWSGRAWADSEWAGRAWAGRGPDAPGPDRRGPDAPGPAPIGVSTINCT